MREIRTPGSGRGRSGNGPVYSTRAIPLKRFFSSDDHVFERKIKLREFNRLNVFLWGTPDAKITIDIRLHDAPEPPPTISFEANPLTITLGESSVLTWETTNAESVSIDNGIGDVAVSATVEVVPVETTIYTLTAAGPGGTATAQVTVTVNPLPPTVQITANPDTIVVGDSAVLSWSSEWATSCVIEPDIGVVALTGSMAVTPSQTTTYKIIATGDGGESSAEVTVTVTDPPPTVDISAADATIILGQSTTLTWSSTNADACTIEPAIGTVDPNGTLEVSPTQTTTYTITAAGSGGTTTDQVTVAVEYPVPEVTFAASPSTVLLGQTATLSWTTAYADSVEIDPNIGTMALSGEHSVSPSTTTTYTLTATGPGGTTTVEATVTVTYPQPIVDLQISPDTITAGESAVLSWTSANAVSVSLDNGIGTVAASGSLSVSPTATITYTITATGVDGSTASDSVSLTVNIPAPVVSFTAEPDTIIAGEASTLTWDTTYADTVTIEPDIGSVAANGSTSVSPADTTTYTITATGSGGTTTESVTVTVIPLPTVNISADPDTISNGQSTTLSWLATNADTCVIEPDVGTVAVSGSVEVSPTADTTYTITATGAGGTAVSSVDVTVNALTAPLITLDPETITIAQGESATLSWTSTGADTAYMDNGVGSVPTAGTITVTPEHTTIYTLTVTGAIGSASARIRVHVTGAPIPPAEGTWGYIYSDKIPADATVEAYDDKRFALVVGEVLDIGGQPIEGVRVHIHDHLEYGTCATDADGQFVLPVDGGALMTVVYEKDGLITSQRQVHTPWNDFVIAETVTMLSEDPAATTLTFDGNADTVFTHRSTPYTDDFGTRSTTLVFTGDNQAYLTDENGNTIHELTTITTRATEYITPASMPAELPPTSAYTYCAELTVDGAPRVRFEKPAVMWVDNFLGFDVGIVVPVGSYNRDRGVWIAEENGVVVKLLDQDGDGTVDALDADGDDQPDDLDGDASYADEVQGLDDPSTYIAGNTYWRAQVSHFTPLDPNWPYGPPMDAVAPNPDDPPNVDEQSDEDCKNCMNSYVEARSRIFHEDIAIPGTDLTLHYATHRVEGYKQKITIPVSGDTVPASLKKIYVHLSVEGSEFRQVLSAAPNQKAVFHWDGISRFAGSENRFRNKVTAIVRIGFVYQGQYYNSFSDIARAFARIPDRDTATNSGTRARPEIIIWKCDKFQIVNTRLVGHANGAFAHGWAISDQHWSNGTQNDPYTLYKGNGDTLNHINAKYKSNYLDVLSLVEAVAGDKTAGYSGDGGLGTDAQIYYPKGITIDAAGNLYVADSYNNRIRKVDTDGMITTVAGNGTMGYGGDGGLATEAMLARPSNVTVDPSGNLYIADDWNFSIRKVDTNGIITTVAGNGGYGSSGDEGPATGAMLTGASDVEVDASGNLYIVDYDIEMQTGVIRRVDTNGFISTIPNTEYFRIRGIAIDNRGNIYFSDNNNHAVFKLDKSGTTVNLIAGTGGPGYDGDGGPADEASLDTPTGLSVDAEGNLYILDRGNNCVRKVDTSGIITTVAGQGASGINEDGTPVTDVAMLSGLQDMAMSPSGEIYVSYGDNNLVGKSGPLSPYVVKQSVNGYIFPEDNGLGYVIDQNTGKHTKTIDLDTGVILRNFDYDDEGHLLSITDQFGNQTIIQRTADGEPSAIISPEGLITDITIGQDSNLMNVAYPDSSSYSFEYSSGGLMTFETEPNGNRFDHVFDANGRLVQVLDQEGGDWHYASVELSNGSIEADATTGEGNLTSYRDYTDLAGRYRSTITAPTGDQTLYTKSANGMIVSKTLPCGMQLGFEYGINTEYKYKNLEKITHTTPAGLQRSTVIDRTYQDTGTDGISDLITKTIKVNDKTTTFENSITESEKIITSAEGRTITIGYDPLTLLTLNLSVPGLNQTDYGYDAKGRLTSATTGTRQVSYTYDTNGFVDSITDPELKTTYYAYDAVGRVTGISRPDGGNLGFSYDANGNMTVLTNPAMVDHEFTFNRVNQPDGYLTPVSGNYSYVYDNDRRLIQTIFPSGKQINNIYTTTQLTQIQTPEGNVDISYLCSDIIGSMSKGTESIAYTYDGNLPTAITLSGTLNQSISYTYNNDFRVESLTYAGATQSFAYDLDNLLTGIGSYTITRNMQNGLPEALSGGALNISRTFNGYGELDSQTVTIGSNAAVQWTLARDNAGRITQKTETADGITSTYDYTYDPMGRLETVTKDGTLVESYGYDLDGTRTSETNTLRGISSRSLSYSDEDHLLSAGGVSYNYDLDGFLTTKIDGADVTTYNYSSRGELLQVDLPDGKIVSYDHDPLGRRIAKRINGSITEKYLWQGLTTLLAVYDGSDSLVQRFEYADGRMPVAMVQGGSTYYLAYDQVGSLRVVTDASGNVVKRVDYDSFGNILVDTNNSLSVPFGFAGGLHDRDIELVRFGLRDYDPDTGRWTAKDPIGFAGGDTDLYGYVQNNPVNYIDPYGLILRPGSKFIVGKALRPLVNKYVSDPAGQRIITSGIAGAITGLGAGIIGGSIAGGAATGPLAGVGAVPGAIIGGISGFSTGFSSGLLYGVIFEMTGIPSKLENTRQYATMDDAMPDSYDDYDGYLPCP